MPLTFVSTLVGLSFTELHSDPPAALRSKEGRVRVRFTNVSGYRVFCITKSLTDRWSLW